MSNRATYDLSNKTKRGNLKPRSKPYFFSLEPGLTLGYVPCRGASGLWIARRLLERVISESGVKYLKNGKPRISEGGHAYSKYKQWRLGQADDAGDTANGVEILSFDQAAAKAKGRVNANPATVQDAATAYMAWFKHHRKSAKETESIINAHILPPLGSRKLADLRALELRAWLNDRVTQRPRVRSKKGGAPRYRAAPKDDDEKRARRATANRILTVLKAILNKAVEDGLVGDGAEWNFPKLKPFPKADEARIRFLSDDESIRLVNACPQDLRQLVRAALLTGARQGELAALTARDVNLTTGKIYVQQSKSGRPRHIPLNPEGVDLFRALAAGKKGDEHLLTKADGAPWLKNHHSKPFGEAVGRAKISPPATFHDLRHAYASHLAQAGVDLLTIAKLLGHADTRITAKHYAHLVDKTLEAAVVKLPSFGGELVSNVQAIPLQRARKGKHAAA